MQLRVAGVRLLAAFLCATWALPLAATPRFEFAPWWDHDNEDFLLQAAIVVGDVTGDGRDDVVVTADIDPFHTIPYAPDDAVLVYVQEHDGRLMLPLRLPIGPALQPGQATTGLALGDLDGDGLLDIVAGSTRGVTVLLADGCGSFTTTQYATPEWIGEVAVLDMDLDGDQDIAALEWNGTLTLFHGDGTGGFAGRTQVDTIAGGYNSLKVGDLDGDGHDDLAVASVQSLSDFSIHAARQGGLAPAQVHVSPIDFDFGGLAIGDWNGDGRDDLAMSGREHDMGSGDYQVVVYLQAADGGLAVPFFMDAHRYADAAAFDDLDNDGRDDLIVLHGGSVAGLSYYFGNTGTTGEFELTSSRTATSWFKPDAIATGDVNGDGCVDLAYADPGSSWMIGGLAVHPGVCTVKRPVSTVPQRAACTHRGARDSFDAAPGADVLWRHATKGSIVLWPSADADEVRFIGTVRDLAWSIVARGDLDGDGRVEIVWRNTDTGSNVAWKGGDPAASRSLAHVPSQAWQVVGAADFDGDGRDDLFWRNTQTGANAVWPGGDHRTQPVIAAVAAGDWRVAGFGDFDRDGRHDVFWRNSRNGANAVWRGADARLRLPVMGITDTGWDVAGIGDVDGDGRDDVFWRHRDTGANALWRSADHATQLPMMDITNAEWQLAGIHDYDGDGPADVMWRNSRTGANVLWLAGNYWTQQPVAQVGDTQWQAVD